MKHHLASLALLIAQCDSASTWSTLRFVALGTLLTAAFTCFAQDIEFYNYTNEDFWVEAYIWSGPPCPGTAYNSDWWICVPANSMIPVGMPPEKFLKQTKIQCVCYLDGDYVGSTHCNDSQGFVFECNSVSYIAGQGDREWRIEYY